uniref:Uncharacterized protein n=1 Tax=Aegilops tauschii subsp. strangulata TaxID=200361 RepID=A0A453B741_AEGTS
QDAESRGRQFLNEAACACSLQLQATPGWQSHRALPNAESSLKPRLLGHRTIRPWHQQPVFSTSWFNSPANTNYLHQEFIPGVSICITRACVRAVLVVTGRRGDWGLN